MANLAQNLHFVLLPFMAQGHIIPMVDIAKLLARRGTIVTIISTPVNATRFKATVTRSVQSGLQIRMVELYFPSEEVGLPKGCENIDMLGASNLSGNFFEATFMLREAVENFLRDANPSPSCIISDMCFPWTTDVAQKFHIPRLIFHGPSCFSLLSMHLLHTSKVLDRLAPDSEKLVLPGLPDRIEMATATFVGLIKPSGSIQDSSPMKDFFDKIIESEKASFGVVANTFEELEPEYVKEFVRVKGTKLWSIGPVSLCNKDNDEKVERGNKTSINEDECLKWLDSHEPGSVVYVCLGSLSKLATSQLIELGLGLEASNVPFIWCIRRETEGFRTWALQENFEERIKGRGLLIKGWAPQVLILSHQAVGGFLTHCGWNSTLEGICAGIQMLTWPLFADQFLNEALVVQILRTGMKVGVESPVIFGEEESVGVLIERDAVKLAIDRLMNHEDEGKERRKRVKELGEMAKRAMEEDGSSYLNMTHLIQEIMAHGTSK